MGLPTFSDGEFCTLGKELIESGAYMEAGLAALLMAESEKIEEFIKKGANKNELKELNTLIKEIVESISIIEKSILEKIELGKKLCKKETQPVDC